MVIVAGFLTYYVALAWTLLEPICGQLWINYVLQFMVNTVALALIVGHIEGYGHREKEKIEDIEIEMSESSSSTVGSNN